MLHLQPCSLYLDLLQAARVGLGFHFAIFFLKVPTSLGKTKIYLLAQCHLNLEKNIFIFKSRWDFNTSSSLILSHLLGVRHKSKRFLCTALLWSSQVLLSPFYRRGNWGWEKITKQKLRQNHTLTECTVQNVFISMKNFITFFLQDQCITQKWFLLYFWATKDSLRFTQTEQSASKQYSCLYPLQKLPVAFIWQFL